MTTEENNQQQPVTGIDQNQLQFIINTIVEQILENKMQQVAYETGKTQAKQEQQWQMNAIFEKGKKQAEQEQQWNKKLKKEKSKFWFTLFLLFPIGIITWLFDIYENLEKAAAATVILGGFFALFLCLKALYDRPKKMKNIAWIMDNTINELSKLENQVDTLYEKTKNNEVTTQEILGSLFVQTVNLWFAISKQHPLLAAMMLKSEYDDFSSMWSNTMVLSKEH